MSIRAEDRPLFAWAVATLLCSLVFLLAPGIDLWVSGLFYRAGSGFPLADWGPAMALRSLVWTGSELVIVLALAGLVIAWAIGRPALWLPARVWGIVLAVYVIGPGLIANVWLKSHWGRPRPDTVEAFGGTLDFVPALSPAGECLRNCSFVSGEASSAAALVVAAALALRHLGPRVALRHRRRWLLAVLALAVTGSLLRVLTGRHFLSDVIFAWLIVFGVALVLDRLFNRHAQGATPPRAPAGPC